MRRSDAGAREMGEDPYRAPSAPIGADVRSRLGVAVACLGIAVAVLWPCLVVAHLAAIYNQLSAEPSASCRPLPVIGVGLSFLSFVGVVLSAVLARVFGIEADAELALAASALVPAPFLLDFLGTFFVIWATGSSLGS